jgi:hypothetical protein
VGWEVEYIFQRMVYWVRLTAAMEKLRTAREYRGYLGVYCSTDSEKAFGRPCICLNLVWGGPGLDVESMRGNGSMGSNSVWL